MKSEQTKTLCLAAMQISTAGFHHQNTDFDFGLDSDDAADLDEFDGDNR